MEIHKSITQEKILDAVQSDEYLGFCVNCGAEAEGVEPDARNYECEFCNSSAVFGAEELLLMI